MKTSWKEAQELRTRGSLVALGTHIRCPVVAIHGDDDPHPADGVKIPLSRVIKKFRFLLLESCGHRVWLERSARDRFYEILKEELRPPGEVKNPVQDASRYDRR